MSNINFPAFYTSSQFDCLLRILIFWTLMVQIRIAAPTISPTAAPISFTFTGAVQSFVVPLGSTWMTIDMYGARGGNFASSCVGGLGARVVAAVPVIEQTTYFVYIGGQGADSAVTGGYNGGANGGTDGSSSGGGGGSDVRLVTNDLSSRSVIAGGGGGCYGSCNGGTSGEAGGQGSCNFGGGGGTSSSGGAAGDHEGTGHYGIAGALGVGGSTYAAGSHSGGGGGGGYYGGGGGSFSGGGGGSSFVHASAFSRTFYDGVSSGNGMLTVTFSSTPTSQPSRQPTHQPVMIPSSQPSCQPGSQPSIQPTQQPTGKPAHPSSQPSSSPSGQPSSRPSLQPTRQPTSEPTCQPSDQPVMHPSSMPSQQPVAKPSCMPSLQPTNQPSVTPSMLPSSQPTLQPSIQPTSGPTARPSIIPSSQPSKQPTCHPSTKPSTLPTVHPTCVPSSLPSYRPSSHPSALPSHQPSSLPTLQPSMQPTSLPSGQPTTNPSSQPVERPSSQPSMQPVVQPTSGPSCQPSIRPSTQPSASPSTYPSGQPSDQPSVEPSRQPSTHPSSRPSGGPSQQPSRTPSLIPSEQPFNQPSSIPTVHPTTQPSSVPSSQPSNSPFTQPSRQPSVCPSGQPSAHPTLQPLNYPSNRPTNNPTNQPSDRPTAFPSEKPFCMPSSQPSAQPSTEPSLSDDSDDTQELSLGTLPRRHSINIFVDNPRYFKIVLPFMRWTAVPSDGFHDVVVNASSSGVNYVLKGSNSSASRITLSDGIGGTHVSAYRNAISFDFSGRSVSNVGDINGDRIDDLVIGVPFISVVYVLFGRRDGFVNMTEGFTIFGADSSDLTGWSVSGAGDVNNDGYADIIIGAPHAETNQMAEAGAVYVIYGKRKGFQNVDLSLTLNETIGFRIQGIAAGDCVGLSVSSAGDVNGDGVDDVITGALMSSAFNGGSAYVVFGGNSPNTVQLVNMSTTRGLTIHGFPWSCAGYSVSGAGDVNGDGFGDILVGSVPFRTSFTTPYTYLVYGAVEFPISISLDTLALSGQGVVIAGGGVFVHGMGDVDGDGLSEVMIGGDYSFDKGAGFAVQLSIDPVRALTAAPSLNPTPLPTTTNIPSKVPTRSPSMMPTRRPSPMPTKRPSASPTVSFQPTGRLDTITPTSAPSLMKSVEPSMYPTSAPSLTPATSYPTSVPTKLSTVLPSSSPSYHTILPSSTPTVVPSIAFVPTIVPVICTPSHGPRVYPTRTPTDGPTVEPSLSFDTAQASVEISTGGIYYAEALGHSVANIVLNCTSNVTLIETSNTRKRHTYTIVPIFTALHRVYYKIENINTSMDIINLVAFQTIHTMKDLKFNTHMQVQQSAIEIVLPSMQLIYLTSNTTFMNLTANNFQFYVSTTQSEQRNNLIFIFSCLIVFVCVFWISYKYYQFLAKNQYFGFGKHLMGTDIIQPRLLVTIDETIRDRTCSFEDNYLINNSTDTGDSDANLRTDSNSCRSLFTITSSVPVLQQSLQLNDGFEFERHDDTLNSKTNIDDHFKWSAYLALSPVHRHNIYNSYDSYDVDHTISWYNLRLSRSRSSCNSQSNYVLPVSKSHDTDTEHSVKSNYSWGSCLSFNSDVGGDNNVHNNSIINDNNYNYNDNNGYNMNVNACENEFHCDNILACDSHDSLAF